MATRWLVLGGIIFTGVFLRMFQLGTAPFQHGDDISTVWAAVWYFPRDWTRIFRLGQGSAEPNPIGIVTLGHGPLQVIIAQVWIGLLKLGGLPINEFSSHLPFAILGSLVMVMAFLMDWRLQSGRAGIIGSLLVSVIPLLVLFSRTSGESHFVLATLLQMTTITLWWEWLCTGRRVLALAAGTTCALDLLTDFGFAALLITLFFAAVLFFSVPNKRFSAKEAFLKTVYPPFIAPVLCASVVHIYNQLASLKSGEPLGMFGRVLSEGQADYTRIGGFFIAPAISNLLHATNAAFLLAFVLCVAAFVVDRNTRSAGAIIALFWGLAYLFPFLFLINRVDLVGHFIPVSIAFCLFMAFVLDRLAGKIIAARKSRRALILSGAVLVLWLSLLLSSISGVFNLDLPSPFYHRGDHGSVAVDRGTKAAALWVRQNTSPQALIWTDPYAQQTESVSLYYYHRPVLSLELGPQSDLSSALRLLAQHLDNVDMVVVGKEHTQLLPKGFLERFLLAADIQVENETSLYIFRKHRSGGATTAVDTVQATTASLQYDQIYAVPSQVLSLPFAELRAAQIRVSNDVRKTELPPVDDRNIGR